MDTKPIKISDLDIDNGIVSLTKEDIRSAAVELVEKRSKPILVNYRALRKTNYLVWGHKYVEAAKKLNIEELPAYFVKVDYNKEFDLLKRANSKFVDWDYEELVSQYQTTEYATQDELYSKVRDVLIYEPNGGYVPKFEDCVELDEYSRAMEDIGKMEGLTEEERKIAGLLATRFIKFNFSYIADRYVNSSVEARKMYERLLAVIVDTDNAIQNGFKKLIKISYECDKRNPKK